MTLGKLLKGHHNYDNDLHGVIGLNDTIRAEFSVQRMVHMGIQ